MPTFLYAGVDGGIAFNIYCDSALSFESAGGVRVRLTQHTAYPSDGGVQIEIEPERAVRFPLYLRIPSFAQGCRVAVNGEEQSEVRPGAYHVVEREWRAGDRVTLDLPLPVRAQAGPRELAVLRGPLVYAYFQSLQDDPQRFHWSQGLYPDDVELVLDSDSPAELFRRRPPPKDGSAPPSGCAAKTPGSHVCQRER